MSASVDPDLLAKAIEHGVRSAQEALFADKELRMRLVNSQDSGMGHRRKSTTRNRRYLYFRSRLCNTPEHKTNGCHRLHIPGMSEDSYSYRPSLRFSFPLETTATALGYVQNKTNKNVYPYFWPLEFMHTYTMKDDPNSVYVPLVFDPRVSVVEQDIHNYIDGQPSGFIKTTLEICPEVTQGNTRYCNRRRCEVNHVCIHWETPNPTILALIFSSQTKCTQYLRDNTKRQVSSASSTHSSSSSSSSSSSKQQVAASERKKTTVVASAASGSGNQGVTVEPRQRSKAKRAPVQPRGRSKKPNLVTSAAGGSGNQGATIELNHKSEPVSTPKPTYANVATSQLQSPERPAYRSTGLNVTPDKEQVDDDTDADGFTTTTSRNRKPQAQVCIHCDGEAVLGGVCINHYLETCY